MCLQHGLHLNTMRISFGHYRVSFRMALGLLSNTTRVRFVQHQDSFRALHGFPSLQEYFPDTTRMPRFPASPSFFICIVHSNNQTSQATQTTPFKFPLRRCLLGVGRILGRILAIRLRMLGDVSDQGACASWGIK